MRDSGCSAALHRCGLGPVMSSFMAFVTASQSKATLSDHVCPTVKQSPSGVHTATAVTELTKWAWKQWRALNRCRLWFIGSYSGRSVPIRDPSFWKFMLICHWHILLDLSRLLYSSHQKIRTVYKGKLGSVYDRQLINQALHSRCTEESYKRKGQTVRYESANVNVM